MRGTGLAIVGTGSFGQESSDDNPAVSVNEACSSGSIEMQPPEGETWTGAIEYRDGAEHGQTPPDGKTVTGGSVANLQVSISSPDARIQRAVVVEGTDLEGPVVAEETCGTGDEGTSDCETNDSTSNTTSSGEDDHASGADQNSPDLQSLLRVLEETLSD